MPTVEKTHGGQVYLTAISTRVATGDQIDVSEGLAEHLTETRGDFRIVGGDTTSADADDETDDAGEAFDLDEFLDQNVPPIEEAIAAGEVDDHLKAIGKASERTGVQDAVGQRRAELEA
mgnify:CR=1 FL=1